MKHIVECSECRFIAEMTGQDAAERAQAVAEMHEEQSRHRGPFVWRMTDELQALITKARSQRAYSWRY